MLGFCLVRPLILNPNPKPTPPLPQALPYNEEVGVRFSKVLYINVNETQKRSYSFFLNYKKDKKGLDICVLYIHWDNTLENCYQNISHNFKIKLLYLRTIGKQSYNMMVFFGISTMQWISTFDCSEKLIFTFCVSQFINQNNYVVVCTTNHHHHMNDLIFNYSIFPTFETCFM